MKRFLAVLVLACVAGAYVFADQVEGIWKSVSDEKGKEGKVTAFWKIEIVNNKLQGKILHVPGQSDDTRYVSDKKEYNGTVVANTVWLKNLSRASEGVWINGSIVDIGNKKGDLYGCDINIEKNGSVLHMKGYITIVFAKVGRDQYWQRSNEAELAAAVAATNAK